MPISRYSRAFVNQFRQYQLAYPGTEDISYEHLSFFPISGNTRDLDKLAKHLTYIVHDVPLINRLIGAMQNEAIPHAVHIAEYIKSINILFADYGSTEPYAATYFNNLVLALNDLAEQADTFQKDTTKYLLNKLQSPFVSERALDNCLDIDADTICKIDHVIEYYMDNFEAYDNYLNTLIRQEESQEKGVIVSSHVAYYLSKLISLIDTFLMHLQATREILFEWDIQLNKREYQELYN